VLQVEPAQERLPPPVDLDSGRVNGGGPQPYRLGVAVAGQVLDLQSDEGAGDDGQLAGVLSPAAAMGQSRVQPVQLVAVAVP